MLSTITITASLYPSTPNYCSLPLPNLPNISHLGPYHVLLHVVIIYEQAQGCILITHSIRWEVGTEPLYLKLIKTACCGNGTSAKPILKVKSSAFHP